MQKSSETGSAEHANQHIYDETNKKYGLNEKQAVYASYTEQDYRVK